MVRNITPEEHFGLLMPYEYPHIPMDGSLNRFQIALILLHVDDDFWLSMQSVEVMEMLMDEVVKQMQEVKHDVAGVLDRLRRRVVVEGPCVCDRVCVKCISMDTDHQDIFNVMEGEYAKKRTLSLQLYLLTEEILFKSCAFSGM